MYKFEETHNIHQNNAEHSSWLILTSSVFTKSSFLFVNCMIPLNSTWVPSLGDKTCHCQFVGLYSEPSRIHPVPFPWPTQHQFPTLSLQAVSTLLRTPSKLPGPLAQHSITDLQSLLRWQKARSWTLFALNCSIVHMQVRQRLLFPSLYYSSVWITY